MTVVLLITTPEDAPGTVADLQCMKGVSGNMAVSKKTMQCPLDLLGCHAWVMKDAYKLQVTATLHCHEQIPSILMSSMRRRFKPQSCVRKESTFSAHVPASEGISS